MREEEIAALCLRKILSDELIKSIVQLNGSLRGVLNAPFEDLFHRMGLDIKTADKITGINTKDAEDKLKWLHDFGGRMLVIGDSDYPAMLAEIYDPPACLYTIGNTSCLNDFCIAMVGARKASKLGEDMAQKLACELAASGVTVVSGFAYGIDINSHIGALKAGGSTAAVLGSGLNELYPKSHKKYIDDVCRDGCIITEYDPDEKPLNYNFPKRNRIVSGLCYGTVVVEASARSGSLITSRLALEHGRDVFAVPTSPLFANNAGNALIKAGSIMVENASDILAEYSHLFSACSAEPMAKAFDDLQEQEIYDAIMIEPLSADELVSRTGLSYTSLATILMTMELSGHIEKCTDGRYKIS